MQAFSPQTVTSLHPYQSGSNPLLRPNFPLSTRSRFCQIPADMRMPMILSKFRQSKLWRNKWKVLFSTVTLAALVIFTSYKLYNYQAKQNFYQAIQEWETKGETTDLNQLLPTPPAADKDFFQHPAFIAEHNKSFDYSINAPHKAKIPGFSPRYSDYNHQSNHRMGVSSDITYWLDSNAPQQPERGRRRRANH